MVTTAFASTGSMLKIESIWFEGIEVDQEIEKIEITVNTKKKKVLPVKKIKNIRKTRNTRKTKRRRRTRKTAKVTSRIGRKRQCSEERSTWNIFGFPDCPERGINHVITDAFAYVRGKKVDIPLLTKL